MQFQNHKAYAQCQDRSEQVACVGETMRRLGEGCTSDDLKTTLGITTAQLNDVADEARAYAVSASTRFVRASVAAGRAA